MKKTVVSLLLIVITIIFITSFCFATNPKCPIARNPDFSLMIDFVNVTNEANPYMSSEGRVMVPIRYMAESIGCEIEWFGETRQVILKSIYELELFFTVGKNTVKYNNEERTIVADAVIVNSRMYIPVRTFELLNTRVDWNAKERIVSLYREMLNTKEIAQIHNMFEGSEVYGFDLYCSTEGKTDLDFGNCDFYICTDCSIGDICYIGTNNLEGNTISAIEKVLEVYFPSENEEVSEFVKNAIKEEKNDVKEFNSYKLSITYNGGRDNNKIELNIQRKI